MALLALSVSAAAFRPARRLAGVHRPRRARPDGAALDCDDVFPPAWWIQRNAALIREAVVHIRTSECGTRPRRVAGELGRKSAAQFAEECRRCGVPVAALTEVDDVEPLASVATALADIGPDVWTVRGKRGESFSYFVRLHGRAAEAIGVQMILDDKK